MKNPSAIPINPNIGSQAQAVCNDMGLDITAVIDYFLRQIVHNRETIPHEAVSVNLTNLTQSETKEEVLLRLYAASNDSIIDFSKVKGKPAKLGGWEGKVKMADDFNAPLDDFEEYM